MLPTGRIVSSDPINDDGAGDNEGQDLWPATSVRYGVRREEEKRNDAGDRVPQEASRQCAAHGDRTGSVGDNGGADADDANGNDGADGQWQY